MAAVQDPFPQAGAPSKEGSRFTGGMMDENSKININLLRNSQGEIDEERSATAKTLHSAGRERGAAEPGFWTGWMWTTSRGRTGPKDTFTRISMNPTRATARSSRWAGVFGAGMRDIERFGEKKDQEADGFPGPSLPTERSISTRLRGKFLRASAKTWTVRWQLRSVAYRKEERFESIDDLRKVREWMIISSPR